MFYSSSLKTLDLNNFDTLNINDLNSMFYGCQNFEFLNLTISNSKAKINDIFKFTNQNFVFCGENIGNICININLPVKKSVLCNNNKKYNNNSHIDYICYMKNLSVYNNYSCDICGNNFF